MVLKCLMILADAEPHTFVISNSFCGMRQFAHIISCTLARYVL